MNLFAGACPESGFPVLDRLSWGGEEGHEALRAARDLLASATVPQELASWLAAQPERELERIADRSLERTTHFKWFLGAKPGQYTVWLHEYKAPDVFAQAMDFAASVHNHRYGFCSRVLSGALHVSDFAIGGDERIRVSRTRTVWEGETMLLTHEDVHRVDRVEPRTCTLIVQGPVARSFSTCYDVATGRRRRIYDLQSRLPRTIELLTAEPGRPISVG
ncbi:hypothetical protein ABZ801_04750 [Actinomadura sp. NPDC047616]|uniref:hypothetical protein n=1 Tax=Actinomadura sp. NPDC047616 TaxID=3155914 RepID=UPI0033FC8B9E